MKHILLSVVLVYCIILAKAQIDSRSPCTTPHNKRGTCKPFSKCDDLYPLYKTKNITTEEKKFLQESQCGFLVEPLVCCSPFISVSENNDFCLEMDNGLKVLGGGSRVTIQEYRWMAQLQYTHKIKKTIHFLCGGSIISRRFILTAAHCLGGLGNHELTSVVLGEYDTSTDPDVSNGITADPIQTYKVSKSIPHEEYQKTQNFENDIGLVQVTKDIVYSNWIKPICLPSSNDLKNRDLDGYEIVVAGWASSGRRENKQSTVKTVAYVTAQSKETCEACISSLGARVTITDNQFCAGSAGVDMCKGDSGGPAITSEAFGNQVSTYLAGILSYGPKGCENDRCNYNVYTKVAAYIPWIEANAV